MKTPIRNSALSLLMLLICSINLNAAEQTYIVSIDSVGGGKIGGKKELTASLTDTDEPSAFTDRAFVLYSGLGKEMLATLLTAVSNNQQVEIVTDLQTPQVVNKGQKPIITQLKLLKLER